MYTLPGIKQNNTLSPSTFRHQLKYFYFFTTSRASIFVIIVTLMCYRNCLLTYLLTCRAWCT